MPQLNRIGSSIGNSREHKKQRARAEEFTTEAQRAQRKVLFVGRYRQKNVLPQNNSTKEQYVVMGLPAVIFVYRYLPIDEKINTPPCALCLCGETGLLAYP
jgi:hypothetical protein